MIGILSALGGATSAIKMAAIGLAVGLIAAAWLHYQSVVADRDAAMVNSGKLEIALQVERAATVAALAAIDEWREAMATMTETVELMADEQHEANEQTRRLNNVLSKHDLEALSLAKPGLIERRINSGTADIFGMFESVTGGGPDDGS